MKKIFWTSIVWILLFCGAIAYIKWFNQPVANEVAQFINPLSKCPVVECEVPDYEECECPDCIDNEVVEPSVCNCPAQMIPEDSISKIDQTNADWTKLFSQLDRIENSVKLISNGEEIEQVSDEQLFQEFMERRANNN